MILLKPSSSFHRHADRRLLWVLRLLSGMAALIVALILLFVLREAWPALQQLGPVRFLRDPDWHPASGGADAGYSLMPMLAGTLLSSCGAVLLAAPLGLGSALFATTYGPPRLRGLHRQLLQLLGGIPSVVVGFWGLVVLTPLIRQWHPPGQSLLAGILCLTVMILPTTALLSEQALRQVPAASLQAAAALGLSRWATLEGVVLPIARGGLLSAVVLASGRALGETMAVLMVAGNVVQVPAAVFDPVRTLTANIALELGYALDLHRSGLFVGGLVLMAVVAVVMALAAGLRGSPSHG
jgi:phosphate transport system permease protein